MPHDDITLCDIADALRRIIRFTAGMTRESFLADDKTQAAVVRQFEIVGEAAKRLSEEAKNKYSRLPWRQMAGMRDKLIHAYDEVDNDRVWQTICKDVPRLLEELDKL